MNQPHLPSHGSRREMRKAMLRMRLEMRRQEIRHEALLLTQPLRQVRDMSMNLRSSGSAPLWLTGGALAFATLLRGKSGWRRWLRIALILMPLLRRRGASHPASGEVTRHN
ncbi:hypothetical protein ACSVIJ_02655 [Pseudomonas sp. NCHU5208]|uniref:hypothetical protein n=1 Tax=unclassified Pseudomonas TaxID=196821 RepID=UPI003F99222E